MLERFLRTFPPAGAIAPISQPTLAGLQEGLGGAVFGGGLLRVHTVESAHVADANVVAGFAEFAGRISLNSHKFRGRALFAVRTGWSKRVAAQLAEGNGGAGAGAARLRRNGKPQRPRHSSRERPPRRRDERGSELVVARHVGVVLTSMH